MLIRSSQPPHLKRPMLAFVVGLVVYAILVVAAFYWTPIWLSQSAGLRPYVAAIPGVVLSGFFVLLYSYMRHEDELKRVITIKSLATACVVGLSAEVISITRAVTGGYAEFDGGVSIFLMAGTFVFAAMYLSWKHR
jgi:hypothetical protein